MKGTKKKRQRREQKRQRLCNEETKQDKVRRSNIMIQRKKREPGGV